MEWLKCNKCSRLFNSGTSATTHYLESHPSRDRVELQSGVTDEEGPLCYSTIHFPRASISLTKIDSPKPKRETHTTKESHKPEEIKLDTLGASAIEKVVMSWFPQRKGGGGLNVSIHETVQKAFGGGVDVEKGGHTSDSDYLPASEEEGEDGYYGQHNNPSGESGSSKHKLRMRRTHPQKGYAWDGVHGNETETTPDKRILRSRKPAAPPPNNDYLHNHSRYKCPLCPSACRNERTYKDHLKRHLPENKFRCKVPECGMVFGVTAALRRHNRTHTKGVPRLALLKKEQGGTFSDSELVEKNDDDGDVSIISPIPILDQEIKKYPDLVQRIHQMRSRHKPGPKGSVVSVQDNKQAKPHSNYKFGDFECPECAKRFGHADSLRSHMKRVHHKNISIRSRSSGEYPCPLCDSVMRNKNTYKDHLKLHLPGNPYTCTFKGCRSVFLNRYHLNVHSQNHTGVEIWHKCSHCSKVVRRIRDIRRHIKSEHPTSPPVYTVVHKQKVDVKLRPANDNFVRIDVGSIDLSDGALQSSSVCNAMVKEELTEDVAIIEKKGQKVGCTVSEGNFGETTSLVLDQEIKKHPEVIQNLRRIWKRRGKTYKCNMCPWFGLSLHWFLRHAQKEHNGVMKDRNTRSIKRYKCHYPSCREDYSTLHGLRAHMKRAHLKNKQSSFNRLYVASYKTGFHSRRNKRVLRCSKCDWIGITQTRLKIHQCGKNMK